MVQKLIAAEVHPAYVGGRLGHAAPDGDEDQSAQQEHQSRGGPSTGHSAYGVKRPPRRDGPKQPVEARGQGHDGQQAHQREPHRHAGKRLDGRIQVEEDGGVEFEVPKRIQRHVHHLDQGNQDGYQAVVERQNLPDGDACHPHRGQHQQVRHHNQVARHRGVEFQPLPHHLCIVRARAGGRERVVIQHEHRLHRRKDGQQDDVECGQVQDSLLHDGMLISFRCHRPDGCPSCAPCIVG